MLRGTMISKPQFKKRYYIVFDAKCLIQVVVVKIVIYLTQHA